MTIWKKHNKSIEMLKEFGLTEHEATVYTYLLEHGTEVGGSKISAVTSLHRQYIYTSLKKLIELGLVETVTHGKRKKYIAFTPTEIEKIAKRRVIKAEDLVRELSMFSTVGHEQDFEVILGERSIQLYEIERIKKAQMGDEQYFVGGGSEHFKNIMSDSYYEYAKLVKVKKIRSLYIGAEHELPLGQFYGKEQSNFEFRLFPNLPKSLVNIMIMNDTLSFYTYASPPILYIVKSKLVAESYKKFFDLLWGMAQKPT